MKKIWVLTAVLLTAVLTVGATALATGGKSKKFEAKLNGFNEVTSKSTVARGTFKAVLEGNEIHYRLSFRNLESDSLFAHVHFSQQHVNGGVSFFLCGGAPPASDKPACPLRTGTVTGVVDAADVIGPADQGIEAGSLSEILRAMRAGAAYANVHTQVNQGGEIRGQIKVD
jgi:hypothetical protein